jgi:hypothetical protein
MGDMGEREITAGAEGKEKRWIDKFLLFFCTLRFGLHYLQALFPS